MKYNSGQALLIIILVMATALTIGLAVISRSVTDIKMSTEQEEAARVFSVAEAGIEEALMAGSIPAEGLSVTIEGITAVVEDVPDPTMIGGGPEFLFPKEIEADDTQTVWLVAHNNDGDPDPGEGRYTGSQIEICWGNETISGEIPALMATVYYREGGVFKTFKYALDPEERGSFDPHDDNCSLAGKALSYSKTLNLPMSSLVGNDAHFALRLKLLYNTDAPHLLGLRGMGADIPSQGSCFESTATQTGTMLIRKIRHCQPYKAPPGVFDYVLYSTGDLIKS